MSGSGDYISREAAIDDICSRLNWSDLEGNPFPQKDVRAYIADLINHVPAADVLPRDEAIKMGAELAAMHGSDATSQQLEEACFKGVEDGMTRRNVRPVVRGEWIRNGWSIRCSECGHDMPFSVRNFCPNCGAWMEES